MNIIAFFHHRPMPNDHYMVHVSVDGVPIPEENRCFGPYKVHHCGFYVSLQQIQHRHWSVTPCTQAWIYLTVSLCLVFNSAQTVWYRTPTISSLSPVSGPPGTVFTSMKWGEFTALVQFELQIKPTS